MKLISLSRFALGASLGLAALTASAFPIASPGTEGVPVIATGGAVTATFEGNSGAYTNLLYLERLADGSAGMDGIHANDLFIFNNQTTPWGTTVGLGTFTAGTELVFRLHVTNTASHYYSGLATRNPDLLPHARAESLGGGVTLVSFEDLRGLPEYPGGFNDTSFTFEGTTAGVPDSSATLGLLVMGLAGLVAARRRRQA